MKPEAGTQIDSYRLIGLCGEGAYGAVYCAVHTGIGQRVALKLLHGFAETGKTRRELEGLRAMCNLRHPHLMPVLHAGEWQGRIFYTMPLADPCPAASGLYRPDTLARRLERETRLTPEAIRNLLPGLLDGLEALHRHNLVHRDVKPANILWLDGRPVLGDIGLVTAEPEASGAGTPGFFRAEWLGGGGELEYRNDLYALGKVIYCALTGLRAAAFPAWSRELPLSSDYSALMRCCTAICGSSPEIGTIPELRAFLRRAPKPRPAGGKRRRLAVLGALLLPAAALAAAWTWTRKSTPPAAVEVPAAERPELREADKFQELENLFMARTGERSRLLMDTLSSGGGPDPERITRAVLLSAEEIAAIRANKPETRGGKFDYELYYEELVKSLDLQHDAGKRDLARLEMLKSEISLCRARLAMTPPGDKPSSEIENELQAKIRALYDYTIEDPKKIRRREFMEAIELQGNAEQKALRALKRLLGELSGFRSRLALPSLADEERRQTGDALQTKLAEWTQQLQDCENLLAMPLPQR